MPRTGCCARRWLARSTPTGLRRCGNAIEGGISLASASADGRGRDVRHHRSRAAAGRPGGSAVPGAGLPAGGAGAGAAQSDHPGGVVRHPRLLARRSDRAARRYVGGGAPRRVGLGPGPAAPSPGGPVAAAVSAAACHRQVVAGVLAADPALSAPQVETALQVVVTSPAVLRALAAALAADPAALSTGEHRRWWAGWSPNWWRAGPARSPSRAACTAGGPVAR